MSAFASSSDSYIQPTHSSSPAPFEPMASPSSTPATFSNVDPPDSAASLSSNKPPPASSIPNAPSPLDTPASPSSNTPPATSLESKPSAQEEEIAECQAAGPQVYDVDEYLNLPEILALLAEDSKPKPASNGIAVAQASAFSNHYMPSLHQQCQKRGIMPVFEIDGDQHGGFGGSVKIGDQTITREEKWPTKKAAKEGLAEKALELVKAMPLKRKELSSSSGMPQNWIGMLQDYHVRSINTTGGPVYMEYDLGTTYACTCKIPAHPTPFGSETSPFPSKKTARFNAAQEAMQFLLSNGLAPPTDDKARKKAKTDNGTPTSAEALSVKRVNDLCTVLNLPLPTYRLQADDASTPDLLSGAAYFPASASPPLPTPGPIGSFQKIAGRKAAREECARGVLRVLMALVADRRKN